MKYYNLVEILNKRNLHMTFDGDKTDLRLHSDEIFNWGAKGKRNYNKAEKEIDAIEFKGPGWQVYAGFDVSGFDYWMKRMEETNYVQITIAFDKEDINSSEIDAIYNALDEAHAESESIQNRYNYNPGTYSANIDR